MNARAYARALGLAALIAVVVRGVALEGFEIPSASMLPGLQVGDYVLVNKLRYGLRLPGGWTPIGFADPRPGQVIVFTSPQGEGAVYVKRVVAVAGETVEIRDKQVLVDGVPRDLTAAYFAERFHVQQLGQRDNFGPVKVPAGQVFVLGDNRDQSVDSRFWGFVDAGNVEGEVFLIYWSADSDDGWVRWERIGKPVS